MTSIVLSVYEFWYHCWAGVWAYDHGASGSTKPWWKQHFVFTEGEDIEKICNTLWSIEMWLGNSVNIGCDVSTPKQVSMGDWLHQMGREEIMLVEGTNTHLPRQMPEPQCNISCPCVASQVVGKMPKFRIFIGDSTQKGEVSFEQWAFEVKSVLQRHTEVTLREEKYGPYA